MPQPIIETKRLEVRHPTADDADFYLTLWTNPDVMVHVGFPQGLRISREEIVKRLENEGAGVFGRLLVVELKSTGEVIGECKLALPDEEGIAEPDIKLLPEHWGQGYGREAWEAIVNYQFQHTGCTAIQTTPNVNNAAAIRLYESVGAVREGEGVHHFPEAMQGYTEPVRYYVYRLYRED